MGGCDGGDRHERAHRCRDPGGSGGPTARHPIDAGHGRAGRCGVDRLYGPRQFRHQHPGRRQIRLRAALGRGGGQPRRHAVPGLVGQARHRHGVEPRRTLPAALSPSRHRADVARQRGRRHGDGPCRIPRRRHRLVAAPRDPAAGRHGHHGTRHLRDPAPRAAWLPLARDRHRGAGRRHRRVLPRRGADRAGRLGGGRARGRGTARSQPPRPSPSRWASSARPSCRTRSISTPA